MADSKKTKKKSGKQVDSIIVILIVIIVLAIIGGGILLIQSMHTPDLVPLDDKPGLETSEEGTYANYLATKKADIGYKNIPLTGQNKGNQVVNFTEAILGTDDVVYFVSSDSSKNVTDIPGTEAKGIKYEGVNYVVDLFPVVTSNQFYLFALSENGIVYSLDLVNATDTKEYKETEAIEVFENGNQVIVKSFDKTTKIIIE